jgi:acid stress-induced BolA-like protein IbaG/YrbA
VAAWAADNVSFLRQQISINMAYSHFILLLGALGFIVRSGCRRHSPFTTGKTMDAASIQALIENGLPGAKVQVQGDDGVHFEAEVVAAQFAGKLPLARHRLVYATLGDLMGGAIHALALKTLTPEEVAARR